MTPRRKKIRAQAAQKNCLISQSVRGKLSCAERAEGRPRNLPGCVRGLIGNMEALGIGDETRQVNGAAAVDLLNQYLPLLREELGDSHV
ncbi:MAG: hypothetical protein ACYCV6_03810 [Steroidobacteraceae bacterium]|jgi:hypothetical protein